MGIEKIVMDNEYWALCDAESCKERIGPTFTEEDLFILMEEVEGWGVFKESKREPTYMVPLSKPKLFTFCPEHHGYK